METQDYFNYWGKASADLPPRRIHSPGWHLLPYHCLDVAAVGYEYVLTSPAFRAAVAKLFPWSTQDSLSKWIGFWLALHDLGKFSEAFQGQCDDLFRLLRRRQPAPGKPYCLRHDTLGWVYWQQVLSDQFVYEGYLGPDSEVLLDGLHWWARSVTGHHGQPPENPDTDWTHHFNRQQDQAAIGQFVSDLADLFLTDEVFAFTGQTTEDEFAEASKQLSWWLAGLTVLADWLGSNSDHFPYCAEPMALTEYWSSAREKARTALKLSGVVTPRPQGPLNFGSIYPEIQTPSPLQQWAADVALADEPQIHLLEDVTGAGKTEAAIFLAHRLMASGVANGFFLALPTMATANAMYGRIKPIYQQLFGDLASLVLAHGQRRLVDEFAQTILRSGPRESDPRQHDETASGHCAAWLADRNKSALLAPAGVGTIDQVLLSVLHSKHQSLRLLGLMRKVLIVDEVHACDAYMQRVLESVLEFHAQGGGSVILLSATLPGGMKQSLLNAFAKGRSTSPGQLQRLDYPLATSWPHPTAGEVAETPLDTRPAVCRNLAAHYVSDEAEVVFAITEALAKGKCACWMRNTVFDALDAYAKFKDLVPKERLILFHARFAYQDRLDTETRILECFGKYSTPEQRSGKLVIATQVAEQSLDADWDFVISDLAPVDRLIQRAGRLQRHPRDAEGRRLAAPDASDQRGQACLWVYGPLWNDNPPANWFKQFLPKASGVYPHHGQLWLTAESLRAGNIAMPHDARTLIESVFGTEATPPKGLEANANRAEGTRYGDISLAQQHVVKLEWGYVREGMDWWSEASSPSRLGEATTTVVLARWQGNRLLPWSDMPGAAAWAYSSLRMAERRLAAAVPETDPTRQAEIQRVMDQLPGTGKWSVLLCLEDCNGIWNADALAAPERNGQQLQQCWSYDRIRGLHPIETSTDTEETE